ncbi:MAG: hypothetical protein ACKVQA_06230 [Burkholderiales bacterium]
MRSRTPGHRNQNTRRSVWKSRFGWKQGTVYAIDGDRNNVMVIEEFDTMEHAKAFAASPDLKTAI